MSYLVFYKKNQRIIAIPMHGAFTVSINSINCWPSHTLKRKIFNLQTKLTKTEEAVEEQKKQKENIEFLELNLLYGHKCRKTVFNKLYKVGTPEYKNCVLQKGKI